MVWYSHLFQNFAQLIVIHTVKGFGIVNKAEIDVFLELSCFFNDPTDVGNLISGSSAFFKSRKRFRTKSEINKCIFKHSSMINTRTDISNQIREIRNEELYAKAFDCVDHSKLWKILKEMGIPNHLTCLLRNLYASQEATDRTGHETIGCFQIRKGLHQGCILSPCLFNLDAEYIMRSTGLEEAQAGIKIAGRNINILRYADDTTLMAESEEELKSLLMKVKEKSEKVGLKLNMQKT